VGFGQGFESGASRTGMGCTAPGPDPLNSFSDFPN
jgi:hypothetical protein